MSLEEAAYKKEIKDVKLSRNISCAALFLSFIMPLFAVNYSNCVGKTTINPSQYDSIVTNQKDYSSKLESINDSIMGLFHILRKSQDTIISKSTNTNTKDNELVKKTH